MHNCDFQGRIHFKVALKVIFLQKRMVHASTMYSLLLALFVHDSDMHIALHAAVMS